MFQYLLVFLFLFPPLHLLIIPLYLTQKNFREFPEIKSKKIYLALILFFLTLILTVNLVSGFFLEDYPTQSNVTQFSVTQNITFIQIVSIVIISPIIEEFYFRGILFDFLKKTQCGVLVIFLTSLLFSTIHFNILSTPTLLTLGFLLGLFKIISNSIIFPVIIHSLFNFFMLSSIIYFANTI